MLTCFVTCSWFMCGECGKEIKRSMWRQETHLLLFYQMNFAKIKIKNGRWNFKIRYRKKFLRWLIAQGVLWHRVLLNVFIHILDVCRFQFCVKFYSLNTSLHMLAFLKVRFSPILHKYQNMDKRLLKDFKNSFPVVSIAMYIEDLLFFLSFCKW